ncbi:hypothetical protein CLV63_1524 [Murinocardiopsis flavida]|uniref:Uncharacterized protein n=1 Tax=Murinocardiopsis flavida TaxID=645275 RepID=A0A2P8C6Z6_9ACTN|nr:hypothetical protein [Murinocardiopsis flavida]PSK80697.1 hypothetical protein CLV63_1524 [Murinocardiopsis flavida]
MNDATGQGKAPLADDLSRIVPESPEDKADILFDRVSESLRDHRDTRATKSDLRNSLIRADAAFQELHDWITDGKPLPDPWRRAHPDHPPA